MSQLLCQGVMQLTKLRQQGWASRMAHAAFVKRYAPLAPNLAETAPAGQLIDALTASGALAAGGAAVGATKVFLTAKAAKGLQVAYEAQMQGRVRARIEAALRRLDAAELEAALAEGRLAALPARELAEARRVLQARNRRHLGGIPASSRRHLGGVPAAPRARPGA